MAFVEIVNPIFLESTMTHRFLAIAFVAVVSLYSAAPCHAQFFGFGGSEEQEERARKQQEQMANQMLMHQLSMLQHNESLQEQLEITDDQVKEFKPIIERFQEAQQEMVARQMELGQEMRALLKEPDPDHEAVQELQSELMEMISSSAEESMKELKEVLLPHQLNRMKQLGRQQGARMQSGNDDLGIPLALAHELGLDAKQRRELRRVTDAEREAYEQGAAELKMKAREKIAETLTAEQREKLHELVGEMYDPNAEFMRSVRKQQKEARQKRPDKAKEEAASDRKKD